MSHLESFLTPPKFLMCDNHIEPSRGFVLHTEFPRFLCEAYVDLDGEMIEELSNRSVEEFGMPLITKAVLIDDEIEYLVVVAVMENFVENSNQKYRIELAEKMQEALSLMEIWYVNEINSYKK